MLTQTRKKIHVKFNAEIRFNKKYFITQKEIQNQIVPKSPRK